MSSSQPNESTFKEISIVPDYRALEMIKANKAELKSFFASGIPIIQQICREPAYGKFRKQLDHVEAYLQKKANKVPTLNTNTAAAIARELQHQWALERNEIVFVLNQLPLDDAHLEMMFPGKFVKEQREAMLKMINSHLGIEAEEVDALPPAVSTEETLEQPPTTVKMEVDDTMVPVKQEEI